MIILLTNGSIFGIFLKSSVVRPKRHMMSALNYLSFFLDRFNCGPFEDFFDDLFDLVSEFLADD